MVITQTPFRISFFGGGTDYPVHFKEHGGAVLATSIDKYIYITCRPLPPFHEHKHRIIYSKMESVRELDEIIHPAVREVYKYMKVSTGLELHHDSDLPARSGMGSSSSFVVGLLQALHALKGEMIPKEKLAAEAIHVEQDLIGEAVGCQDQIMAACGGFNHVIFKPGGGFEVNPVILKTERMNSLQSHLMLFYTGMNRVASEVAKEQIKATPKKYNELKTMGEMVNQAMDILNSQSPISEFGKLLDENWQIKRSLTSKVTNPEIDEIYNAGRAAGAIGGKLLGAGNGGFMLLFVPPEKQKEVQMRLGKLLHVKFAFERGGSNVIFYRQQVA